MKKLHTKDFFISSTLFLVFHRFRIRWTSRMVACIYIQTRFSCKWVKFKFWVNFVWLKKRGCHRKMMDQNILAFALVWWGWTKIMSLASRRTALWMKWHFPLLDRLHPFKGLKATVTKEDVVQTDSMRPDNHSHWIPLQYLPLKNMTELSMWPDQCSPTSALDNLTVQRCYAGAVTLKRQTCTEEKED